MKFLGYCQKCRRSLCEEHAYFRVDGNNIAITNSSPYLCRQCYKDEYGEEIKSDTDILKNKIINALERSRRENHIEMIRIDNLIRYIESI